MLSKIDIEKAFKKKELKIIPFSKKNLQPDSYKVHLDDLISIPLGGKVNSMSSCDFEKLFKKKKNTRADENNQKVTNKEKEKLEREAFEKISNLYSNKKELVDLWEELQKGETKESKFVDDLDKIEMVLQALDYKKLRRNGEHLDEFFETSGPRIKTEKGRELWDKVRKEYLK